MAPEDSAETASLPANEYVASVYEPEIPSLVSSSTTTIDFPSSIVSSTKKVKREGYRQKWKALGAAGDQEALAKLQARREADRISRRKSRQLLKERGLNGDPIAQEILKRTKETDTLAHRNRRAMLRINAATGDVEAIEKLKRSRDVDVKAHKKHRMKKKNEILKSNPQMPNPAVEKCESEGTAVDHINKRTKFNQSPNVTVKMPSKESVDHYVDVEAEAVSALESLYHANKQSTLP